MRIKKVINNTDCRKSLIFKIKNSSSQDVFNLSLFDLLLSKLSSLYNCLIDTDSEIFDFNKANPANKQKYLTNKEREALTTALRNSFDDFAILYSDFSAECAERYNSALKTCFRVYEQKKKNYFKNPGRYDKPVFKQPKQKEPLDYKSIKSKAPDKGIKLKGNNLTIFFGKGVSPISLRIIPTDYEMSLLKNSEICYYQIKRFDVNDYRLIVSIICKKTGLSENFPALDAEMRLRKVASKHLTPKQNEIKRNTRNSKKSKPIEIQKKITKLEKCQKNHYPMVSERLKEQAQRVDPTLICKTIGTDFGCSQQNTIVCSDGTVINFAAKLYEEIAKLELFELLLTMRKQGGSNYKRLVKKIKKLEERIVNIRDNCCHKITSWMVNNYDKISIDDFQPGKAADGSELKYVNKQIYNIAIGRIKFQLAYKAVNCDKETRLTPCAYTSQACCCDICNKDYSEHKKLELKDRIYQCNGCDQVIDRDLNSAIVDLKTSGFRACDQAFVIKFQQIVEILSSK
jgi:transposase